MFAATFPIVTALTVLNTVTALRHAEPLDAGRTAQAQLVIPEIQSPGRGLLDADRVAFVCPDLDRGNPSRDADSAKPTSPLDHDYERQLVWPELLETGLDPRRESIRRISMLG